jgi:hypothetical protein
LPNFVIQTTMSIMETKTQVEIPETKKAGIEEDRELSYWSNKFGIAKDELREVIRHGGTFTEAIEKYVNRLKYAV